MRDLQNIIHPISTNRYDEKKTDFYRRLAEEMAHAYRNMQNELPSGATLEDFLGSVHTVVHAADRRKSMCAVMRAELQGELPRYTSEPEPEAQTPEALALFPKAHVGNVNRLIVHAYRAECGLMLSPSTRAYVILKVLMLKHIAAWNERSYLPFVRHLQGLTGEEAKFDSNRIHPYWRRLPLSRWASERPAAGAPRNAKDVLAYAGFVARCLGSGKQLIINK